MSELNKQESREIYSSISTHDPRLVILLRFHVGGGQVGRVEERRLVALVLRLRLHIDLVVATVATTTVTRPGARALGAFAVTAARPFAITGP